MNLRLSRPAVVKRLGEILMVRAGARRPLCKQMARRGRGSCPEPVAGQEPRSRSSPYQPVDGVLPLVPVAFVDLVIMLPLVLTTKKPFWPSPLVGLLLLSETNV